MGQTKSVPYIHLRRWAKKKKAKTILIQISSVGMEDYTVWDAYLDDEDGELAVTFEIDIVDLLLST